jgi:hypothetical protein
MAEISDESTLIEGYVASSHEHTVLVPSPMERWHKYILFHHMSAEKKEN